MNVDAGILDSEKSNSQLATQIAQLLVDIQSIDAQEFMDWAKANPGNVIDESRIDVRMKRFTQAFEFMFPTKKYKRIETIVNEKQIVFEENGREMSINQLSSGEKQIVFRGCFLLKDQKNAGDNLILIDEPEISLHPNWQLKVLSFLKKLFTNQNGAQTSQIIISTHSPFILHNSNRSEDKVIVLKKDADGKIYVSTNPQFYGWSPEKAIEDAFNLFNFLGEDKITVFVEGETDETYYNKCLTLFGKEDAGIEFVWIGRTNDKGNAEFTGDSALTQAKAFLVANPQFIKKRVVLLYDSDTTVKEEQLDSLFVRKMTLNTENTQYRKGVENLLTLNSDIDPELYVNTKEKDDGYGSISTLKSLNKKKLCSFICGTLPEEKQKIILLRIHVEIEKLLKDLGKI